MIVRESNSRTILAQLHYKKFFKGSRLISRCISSKNSLGTANGLMVQEFSAIVLKNGSKLF